MASRKRPRTANHDPPPPTLPSPNQAKSSRVRTSTRQAMSSRPTRSTSARGKSSVVPTPTETPSITTSDHHGDGSRDASDAGNSRGSSYTLKNRELLLAREALKIVNNTKSAELIVLELMDKYSFSLSRLIELLSENNLKVSFSKVKYHDIAPRVGLNPNVHVDNIPNFEIFYARLPKSVFSKILIDLQVYTYQYGPPSHHNSEKARARFLSGYFNRIVGLFSGLLFNSPGEILEDEATTTDRLECRFNMVYGGVTVVFIVAKPDIGNLTERLDCYAQVIAECDACAWANSQYGYRMPIMAILCYGDYLYFFKFEGRRQTGNATRFFLGRFPNGFWRQRIVETADYPKNPEEFLRQTRLLCESLYYVFLSGYQTGLEAHWNESVEESKNGLQESTPKWHAAKVSAGKALEEAKSAWNLRQENKLEESKASAERALQFLTASVAEVPDKPEVYVPQLTDELKRFT